MNPTPSAITDRLLLLVSQILFTAIVVAVLIAVMLAAMNGVTTEVSSFEQNILTSIATATVLNMKEVITTTLALATGRQVSALGAQLGQTGTSTQPVDGETGQPKPQPVVVEQPNDQPIPTKDAGDLTDNATTPRTEGN